MNIDPSSVCLTFGKHKDRSVAFVYQSDKSYLDWCMKQPGIMQKHPLLLTAINMCNNMAGVQQRSTNNLIPSISTYNNLIPLTSTPIYNNNIVPSIGTTTTNQGVITLRTGNYGIEYGTYVNFPEHVIRAKMTDLGIRLNTIDTLIRIRKAINSNINAAIIDYADTVLDNKSEYNRLISLPNGVEYANDVVKISLAWKYGIIKDKFKVFEFPSIQDYTFHMWVNGNKSMDEIIRELTRQKTKEEKQSNVPTGRRYCKKLPYLFTPAMYQLTLLGINDREMKRLHKCIYDGVMDRLNFAVNIEIISELFRLDWRNEYYKFVSNPYAFYTLGLERCDHVMINSGRNPNDFSGERYLGQISRVVYDKCKINKWTATPDWLLVKEYPNYVDHKDILRDNYGLVFDMELSYLRHIYYEEEDVANFIRTNITLEINPIKQSAIEYCDNFTPTEEQDIAVRNALSKSISIITGIAGTGKTSIIKQLVHNIKSQNRTYVVCSFTAKAVKRIEQVLGNLSYTRSDSYDKINHVKTIHSTIFSITDDKSDIPDYIIIDEATMVSLSLMSRLLRLVTNKNKVVIMLGDINQLSPIKYGRPFEDIINSRIVHINTLTENRRVIGGIHDPIIINSTDIVKSPNYLVYQADNFVFISNNNIGLNNADTLINDITNIVRDNNITLETISQHKFITSLNDDNTELNRILSSLINIKSSSYSRNVLVSTRRKDTYGNSICIEMKYTIGDPVIFTKNKVYPHVSNGCEGVIIGIADDHLIINANDKDIRVPLHKSHKPNYYWVKHVLLSYCVTVHKSQGSQWRQIYHFVNSNPSALFNNKRLTYTAITRAERKCTIIDNTNSFVLCCRQNISAHYGGLVKRLRNNMIILPDASITNNTSSSEVLCPSVNQICTDFSLFQINQQTGIMKLS